MVFGKLYFAMIPQKSNQAIRKARTTQFRENMVVAELLQRSSHMLVEPLEPTSLKTVDQHLFTNHKIDHFTRAYTARILN